MTRSSFTSLPDDLFDRVEALGCVIPAHPQRPAYGAARADLVAAHRAGDVLALPGALRALGRVFTRSIHGQLLPPTNWITRTAYHLASEIEGWLIARRMVA